MYKEIHIKNRKEKQLLQIKLKKIDAFEEVEDAKLFELKSDKLAKAMSLIDPKDKMILLMKYQDDMSIKEIQEALEVGESAVKMRIKRAKAKVISTYEEL